jgi:hypothetical protein
MGMKKICALIVCMTVCGAALFAQTAASDFDTKAEGNGVVIAGYKGKGGDVAIPIAIGGKAVIGIGEAAFLDCSSLATVTIPAGVTTIGNGAFFGCSGLTSVTIPDSVTTNRLFTAAKVWHLSRYRSALLNRKSE